MDEPSVKDPRISLSRTDLEEIHSHAVKMYVELNQKHMRLDDSQYRTYCFTMAVQAWLRSKGLLKIILD